MNTLPERTTWSDLNLAEIKQALMLAENKARSLSAETSSDEAIRITAERDELWMRRLIAENESKDTRIHPGVLFQ
jgi:hypothetical protein